MKNQKVTEKARESHAEYQHSATGYCDECGERAIFALLGSDGREFSIGLTSVLECLMFAQKTGCIPPIPSEWWIDIANEGIFEE
jgi:hypothetical protein